VCFGEHWMLTFYCLFAKLEANPAETTVVLDFKMAEHVSQQTAPGSNSVWHFHIENDPCEARKTKQTCFSPKTLRAYYELISTHVE